MRIAVAMGVMVALVAPMAACATNAPDGARNREDQSSVASSRQQNALKDGRVSQEEYEAGFHGYERCLAKNGYQLQDAKLDGDLYDFGVPSAAVDSGVDARCYDEFWNQIDSLWQVAHQDTSDSATIVRSCLTSHGLTASERYEENLRVLEKNNLTLADCDSPVE